MTQIFNTKKLIPIETEGLHEKYTGRRYGYKFKAEYEFKKTQTEAIYHRIFVVCREIQPNSPEVNVEVSISCSPHGIEEKVEFIAEDRFAEGSRKFLGAIVANAFDKTNVLQTSYDYERANKK